MLGSAKIFHQPKELKSSGDISDVMNSANVGSSHMSPTKMQQQVDRQPRRPAADLLRHALLDDDGGAQLLGGDGH